MVVTLDGLPSEILLYICQYLPISDLYNFSKSCKTFQGAINSSHYIGNRVLVTNQTTERMKERALRILPIKEKIFVSGNWHYGKYKETCIVQEQKQYMPWLNLTKDYVLISKGEKVQIYKRCNQEIYLKKVHSIGFPNDVVRFSYKPLFKNGYVVSGCRKGMVYVWEIERGTFWEIQQNDQSDIHTVDIGNNEFFASGSRSGVVQVVSFKQQQTVCTLNANDHIWSMEYSKSARSLAVGTAKYNSSAPLQVFDTERGVISQELGKSFLKGSGILDLHWFDSNILLTGGYDALIRKWDLRTGTCVHSWEDPYNSTIYCLDTDGSYTILAGTQNYGRVVLWDTRQTKCVQMYFMRCCRQRRFSSPVYSLAFDAYHLFVATDKNLTLLDFSYHNMPSKDYVWIF